MFANAKVAATNFKLYFQFNLSVNIHLSLTGKKKIPDICVES